MIRSLRATTPAFLVDNGDVNEDFGRQSELKYETAMKAMAEMGYAGANVGELDLLLGIDYLKYVADFTSVPLLSANIMDPDGNPVFQPFVMQTVNVAEKELTAAAIGIISTSFKDEIEFSNPGLIVEEYMPLLEQLVVELRQKADVLVLLAHMDEDEAGALAERFPQIDLLVAGHSGDDPFAVPVMKGEVPIVVAGTGGKSLGVASFEFADRRAKLKEHFTRKLTAALEDSPSIVTLLGDYKQMVRAERLIDSFPRTKHGEAQFQGDDACGKCHKKALTLFREDKHTHAFDVLVEKGDEYDPECVGCHTVGFGYVSGFRAVDSTPELKHVGCENCHGPGSWHAENTREEGYGDAGREICVSCHDLANSPKFVYEEYLKKLLPHSDLPLPEEVNTSG